MGRGEERVRLYGKSNIETYFTICKIYSQQEFAIWLSKFKQGLCINLERWDGKGDVRELQNGRDIYVMQKNGAEEFICRPAIEKQT